MDEIRRRVAARDVGTQRILFDDIRDDRPLTRERREPVPPTGAEPAEPARSEPFGITLAELNARLERAGLKPMTIDELRREAVR